MRKSDLEWMKGVLQPGLSMMTEEARQERLEKVFSKGDAGELNGAALKGLVAECATALVVFSKSEVDLKDRMEQLQVMTAEDLKKTDCVQWLRSLYKG